MAVKSELGDDGFDVWDQWSQGDESYNERDARAVWRSITPNGKVALGTLLHQAKLHGYKPNGWHRAMVSGEHVNRAKRAEVATKALAVLKAALPARADHAYLVRKQIPPTVTLREIGRASCRERV